MTSPSRPESVGKGGTLDWISGRTHGSICGQLNIERWKAHIGEALEVVWEAQARSLSQRRVRRDPAVLLEDFSSHLRRRDKTDHEEARPECQLAVRWCYLTLSK